MRVLTDQAETGAVTIALPQDVQAEAFDWPEELFAKRVWHITRPAPDPAAVARAVEVLRSARKPLIVAGGGLLYSEATEQLRRFAEATGIPVADTQAGKGSILWEHAQAVGGVGSTGSPVANALARDADVVLGIGTRYSDFTTASKTAFQNPDVRFVNLNVASLDAVKLSARAAGRRRPARAGGADRGPRRATASTTPTCRATPSTRTGGTASSTRPSTSTTSRSRPRPRSSARSTSSSARTPWSSRRPGSMPGDLQMLWRAQDPKQYHVEYALLLHGLRDRRRARRQDGRARSARCSRWSATART